MKEKVLNFIEKQDLIRQGDKVLVALSGGPDSVALLSLLYELKDKLEIKLGAAHVNHGLRGESADADEAYARKICAEYDIEFYSKNVDIHKISIEEGISCEMAGREVRYNFFSELVNKKGYNKVAIAHNANDQAETLLMRIMRGTGLEGLEGIKPKRDDIYIRPILCLSRPEIEKYCEEKELSPRIDESNLENIYSRNKVRLEMIPYIEKNFNTDIVNTLNRFANLIKVDNEYILKETNKKISEFLQIGSNNVTIDKKFFENDDAIVTRGIRIAISKLTGSSYNIEMKHIYDIMNLQKGSTNKKISLPKGISCENIYKNIKFYYNTKKDFIEKNEIILKKEDVKNLIVNFGEYELTLVVEKNKKNIDFSSNNLIKYFNYDNIKEEIIIRSRNNGDKMIPIGMKSHKKLKDIFINEKIPADERKNIPVILFDDEIAYLVGVKTSNLYRITKDCKNVLKVCYRRKE